MLPPSSSVRWRSGRPAKDDRGRTLPTLVNRRTDRVKQGFKWAVAEELIPVTVYDALRTLAVLRRGRTEVREAERGSGPEGEGVAVASAFEAVEGILIGVGEKQRLVPDVDPCKEQEN
jgi:hypothetical protein